MKQLDEDLLRSGVLVVTGGRDQKGHLLLTFPPSSQANLTSRHTAAHLVLLTEFHRQQTAQTDRNAGFSFLAQLTSCNKEAIHLLLDVINTLQAECAECIARLLIIQPKSKDLQKILKKRTGQKPSKKHPQNLAIETVMLSEVGELTRYVDKGQLTKDFGGKLDYNHAMWVNLLQAVDVFDASFGKILNKLPEAEDKVAMLKEYDIPEADDQAEDLLQQIINKYHDIMGNLNLEHTIDEMKALHSKLGSPQASGYYQIIETPTFANAKIRLDLYIQQLTKSREKLKATWQQAEARVVCAVRISKYKTKAEKVLKWIEEVGLPTLNQEPEIADCLSKAEMLRNHFETGFYNIAMNVIWLSEKILRKMDGLIVESTCPVSEFANYSRQFQAAIDFFQLAANRKQEIYAEVHYFFHASMKIARWYRRTLAFLPVDLLLQTPVVFNGYQSFVLRGSVDWKVAIDNYLQQHPQPQPNHLAKLKNVIPVINNMSFRNQARLLINRVEALGVLLSCPEYVHPVEVNDIFRWKEQVEVGMDDITLNLASSLPEIGTPESLEPDETSKHVSFTKRTPKLKSRSGSDDTDESNESRGYFSMNRRHWSSKFDISSGSNSSALQGDHHVVDRSHNSNRVPKLDLSFANDSAYKETAESRNFKSHSGSSPRSEEDRDHCLARVGSNGWSRIHRSSSRSGGDETCTPPRSSDRSGSSSRVRSADRPRAVPSTNQNAADERYVSLDKIPAVASLPPSLHHIDMYALHDNLPQTSPVTSQSVQHRHDSTGDSGIGQNRSVTDVSRSSGNTPGLSPAQPLDASQQNSFTNIQTRSMPDLVAMPTSRLGLTEDNVETIVSSNALTPEEKLNLMAAMCECDDDDPVTSTPELYTNRQNGSHRPTSAMTLPVELRHKQKTRTARPVSADFHHYSSESSALVSKEPPSNTNEGSRRKYGRKLSAKSRISKQCDETSPDTDGAKIDASRYCLRLSESKVQEVEGLADNTGIDIEGWMKDHSAGTDNVSQCLDIQGLIPAVHKPVTLHNGNLGSKESLENYREKLQNAKYDRKSEELELENERQRLQTLEIQEQEVRQEEVELSLLRTQKLLQEHEKQTRELKEARERKSECEESESDSLLEESTSEESGVYTNASSESKIKCLKLGQPLSENQSPEILETPDESNSSPDCLQDVDAVTNGKSDMSSPTEGNYPVQSDSFGVEFSDHVEYIMPEDKDSLSKYSNASALYWRKQYLKSNVTLKIVDIDIDNVPDETDIQDNTDTITGNGDNDSCISCSNCADQNVGTFEKSAEQDNLGNSVSEVVVGEVPCFQDKGGGMQARGGQDECFRGGGDYVTLETRDMPLCSLPSLNVPVYANQDINLKTPVIIDNGSGLCKCGLANQEFPSIVFPAIVGRPKYEEIMAGSYKDYYVGEAAENLRGVLKLQYPLEHGSVTHWHDMELLWNHAFHDQLRVDPEEHPVMITEPPMNAKNNRERMAEILFETFQVPAMYVALQAVLALYSTGRTTGVVFDSGDGVSHIVPVYQGYSINHAIDRLNLAGRDLTDYLIKLMMEGGYTFNTSAEREIARDIKEQLCYVAMDYQTELQQATDNADLSEYYTLPDGNLVTLTTERFRCPEALFQPSLLGKEHGGIHEMLYSSVAKCDIDMRKELLSNIVLSGGSTMFPGLCDRLQKEVADRAPSCLSRSVHVNAPTDQNYLVWQGGAILASMPSFANNWVFQQEYQEIGSDIIHRKCF